ncbi:MAG: GtrA family protein [Sphingomicrobium sp.]
MTPEPEVQASLAQSGLRSVAGRPLRFLIAGALNTGFGLAIFPLLLWSSAWLAHHYMVALIIAQAAGLLFAFTTYKIGVFQAQGQVARQFGVFSSFYLFNYAANWAVLPVLVEYGHVRPVFAQLGFVIVLMIGSYFWHSRVTFRERERVR